MLVLINYHCLSHQLTRGLTLIMSLQLFWVSLILFIIPIISKHIFMILFKLKTKFSASKLEQI